MRYIQNPKTGKLVPRETYLAGQETKGESAAVHADFDPFLSPVDRKMINSRKELKEHHKRHGTTDSRDYPADFVVKRGKARMAADDKALKISRRDDLRRAFSQHGIHD